MRHPLITTPKFKQKYPDFLILFTLKFQKHPPKKFYTFKKAVKCALRHHKDIKTVVFRLSFLP